MELTTAIKLIERGVDKTAAVQVWADLGAGNGLFTKALATILNGGLVYAIDKDLNALRTIDLTTAPAEIRIVHQDFSHKLTLEPLDGVLMANALHYLSDPLSFLKQVKAYLKPTANFILVEYDLMTSNQWVPYPVTYKAMLELAAEAGFGSATKLSEIPSRYNSTNMYSALLK